MCTLFYIHVYITCSTAVTKTDNNTCSTQKAWFEWLCQNTHFTLILTSSFAWALGCFTNNTHAAPSLSPKHRSNIELTKEWKDTSYLTGLTGCGVSTVSIIIFQRNWQCCNSIHMSVIHCKNLTNTFTEAGIILGMGSANESRHYILTPALIGRVNTQNDRSLQNKKCL